MKPTSDRDGQIVAKQFTGAFGREMVRYTWKGGAVVRVSGRLLYEANKREIRIGESYRLAGFQVRVLDEDFQSYTYLVCMDDSFWRFWFAWVQVPETIELIYRRLIVTAAVWNLARYDVNTVPTWRDLAWRPRRNR